ncbi:MAG: hypothetical protein KDB03_15915 [Planctomycetales bacterium]|nr:hypothetical protein [Planctomycetales bacterium]
MRSDLPSENATNATRPDDHSKAHPSPTSSSNGDMPEAIDMDKSTVGEASNALLRMFQYSASLPERTLRSAGALAGGLVRESANWLVPSAFRNSRSYSIFVQQMLDFVVNDLGGVKRALTGRGDEPNQDEVFLARKTVGNLLDMTALATFHMSPLTVLAIFSDVAYGSKVYMQELSARLKEHGIIAEDTTIDGVTDLISALEQASGGAVGMFDQPPISISGLRKTIAETQEAVERMDPNKLLPYAEIDQLWRQMDLAAQQQNASIWDVSATISIVALNSIQSVGKGTLVSLEIAGNMFQQHIIEHYWEGLRSVEREGLIPTLSKASEPYLEAVWHNFSMDRKTWTEQLLSGELLKWGWSQITWPRLAKG